MESKQLLSNGFHEDEEDVFWFIGTFAEGSDDCVEWSFYPPQQAWRVSQQYAYSKVAHVLWNSDNNMEFACSGASKSDVAAILEAYRLSKNVRSSNSSTRIDRAKVDQLVQQGLAPSVPIYSSTTTQKVLIKLMEWFFHRKALPYFAAAPLRLTSIYNFDLSTPAVAITIDDAPCRFRCRENSFMTRILELLKQYNAKATFMVVESFVKGHEEDLVRALREGHELANHGIFDASFKGVSPTEFEKAVDQCNATINSLQKQAGIVATSVPFFRAPHAYYTQEMETILHSKGMRNVMCDSYASCPIVQDSDKIADILLKQAQPGSILLIHMPEKGFRDWTLPAVEKVLQGLQQRNMQMVTLSELEDMSKVVPAQMGTKCKGQ